MTGMGVEEIWEGVWKKVQYPKRGFEKGFDSREGF